MKINGKEFTVSANSTFIVKDTYLELSAIPTAIAFQYELGVAPSPEVANALYYSWQPGAIMEILFGQEGDNTFEIYWFNSTKQTVEAFTTNDLSAINQTLVKEFRYEGQSVEFAGRYQSFSILAPSTNTTVEDAVKYELVKYKHMELDGNTMFVIDSFYDELTAMTAFQIEMPTTSVGYVMGSTLNTLGYDHYVQMVGVAPNTSVFAYVNSYKGIQASATKNFNNTTFKSLSLNEMYSTTGANFTRKLNSVFMKNLNNNMWTSIIDTTQYPASRTISRNDLIDGAVPLTPFIMGARNVLDGSIQYGTYTFNTMSLRGVKPHPEYTPGNNKYWETIGTAKYTPATINDTVCLLEEGTTPNGEKWNKIIYPTSGNPTVHN